MKTTCMKTSESCVLRVFANVMNLEWTFFFVCLLIITHGFTRNFFFVFFFYLVWQCWYVEMRLFYVYVFRTMFLLVHSRIYSIVRWPPNNW